MAQFLAIGEHHTSKLRPELKTTEAPKIDCCVNECHNRAFTLTILYLLTNNVTPAFQASWDATVPGSSQFSLSGPAGNLSAIRTTFQYRRWQIHFRVVRHPEVIGSM